VTTTNLGLPGAPPQALPEVLFSASETRSGWVAGGVELMFLPAWSVRLEYDYYGFPDKSVGFTDGAGDLFTEDIHQNMQTVTVGINYHFGFVAPAAAPAPYVTK
jgi:outer membrane immunogenic protein